MKTLMTLVVSALWLGLAFTGPAFAATGQQNKMSACNTQANEKGFTGEGKGPERKAFLKECLSAKPEKSAKTTQQEKMKSCNKEAGDKKMAGEARKTFMKACLSS